MELKPVIIDGFVNYVAELDPDHAWTLQLSPKPAPTPWGITVRDRRGLARVATKTNPTSYNVKNRTPDDYARYEILPDAIDVLKKLEARRELYATNLSAKHGNPKTSFGQIDGDVWLKWTVEGHSDGTVTYSAPFPDPADEAKNAAIVVDQTEKPADKRHFNFTVTLFDGDGRVVVTADFSHESEIGNPPPVNVIQRKAFTATTRTLNATARACRMIAKNETERK